MFEQLAHTNRADVLDHVQRDQRFAGIHARGIAGLAAVCKPPARAEWPEVAANLCSFPPKPERFR